MSKGREDMLDILNILSFLIGYLNLEENLTQSDKQDLMSELDMVSAMILSRVEKHLVEQDSKIERILKVVEDDSR